MFALHKTRENPRISSAYKLYAFYYFYIVVLSVSVCQKKKKKKKWPNNKKEIYNDKYRLTRDRLFSLYQGKNKLCFNEMMMRSALC